MLDAFKQFIARHDLCSGEDRILLAVSGGLDSMVLLSLFREVGYTVGVAHCNFQLRGKESDEDEAFVRGHCKKSGIVFFSRAFETKNYAEAHGVSIQMAARELRYKWFGEILEKEKYSWLATGHHLNDNLETVLLRWISGSGLDQLTGISWKHERVIRPLLFATRESIQAYAKSRKIRWREDSSNDDSHYKRNFIRHHVVPKLKEINPSLELTFETSLGKLKGAYELMQRGLEQLKDSATRNSGNEFFIDKSILMILQNPAFVCYEWLRPFGFDWDVCVQLATAVHGQPGKQFFSHTHRAVVDRDSIIVSPRAEELGDILIEEGQDKAALGDWMLTIRPAASKKIQKDRDWASVDLSKIKYPMLWRRWKAGDAFYPIGMGHRKKVSDFLIDGKVSQIEKSAVTVLESGNEVVWVVGYRMDERFKVTSKTNSVLEIHLSRI